MVFFRTPLVRTETAAIGRRPCGYCECPVSKHTFHMDRSTLATWFCCNGCRRPCLVVKHLVENPMVGIGAGYA